MKWAGKNIKHYKELGYVYTKIGDIFYVKAEDLSKQSNVLVEVSCDYCGDIHKVTFARHMSFGDTCVKCSPIKVKETNQRLYGVDNAFQREDIKKKSKDTVLNKYNVENIQQCSGIKEKTKSTNLKRYGVPCVFQSEEIKSKIKDTMIERYNVENCSQYPEFREKALKHFVDNGVWTSAPEEETIKIVERLYGENSCKRQYFTKYYYLDCLLTLDKNKIDIEYDCNYFHDKQKKHDEKRDKYHMSRGYKILRIKAGKEIPTESQLKLAIDELINTDLMYKEIVLER